MRLKHIQLSGFKSFVDPTQVSFPGQLSGVVGPNGCGKSNIIDAVRWVMGESSAKHLRGESIADVIFNGSGGRAPVGQASVELAFDNSDGKLGGEYAQYNEIALRRVVNRDGQSIYYLNNTRCRRRDITDIFRGTGLGPRSYAIIEQGMISRLIEAKPEELRVYLEEAAGITKYKDRRRETELRIEHTRTNLARLSDLREELGNQLERLQRQSKAAEKYKEYKTEEHQYNTQLHALRFQELNKKIEEQKQKVNQLAVAYEKSAAEQTHTVSQIEQIRVTYSNQNEQVQDRQAEYYSASAEVSRIEQEINHLKQRKNSLENDLSEAQQQYQTAQALTLTDTQSIQRYEEALAENTPLLAQEQEKLTVAQEALQKAEESLAKWQRQWDELQQALALQQKNTELLRVQVKHAQDQSADYKLRMDRLKEEQEKLNIQELISEREQLEKLFNEGSARHEELLKHIDEKSEALTHQKNTNNENRQKLHENRVVLQQSQGQHASLEALQKAALGHDNKSLTSWLEQQKMLEYPRLAQGLKVTSGWELAVEFVLKEFLPAVVLEKLESLSQSTTLPGQLSMYFPTGKTSAASNNHSGWKTLRDHIETQWALHGLVADIYCAPDLTTALSWRDQLSGQESIVTPEGVWLGQDWLRVYQPDAAKDGVIARQQSLTDLNQRISQINKEVEDLAARLQEGEQQVLSLDKEREALREAYQQHQRDQSKQQAGIQEINSRIKHQQHREQTITQELNQLEQQIDSTETRLQQWQEELITNRDQLDQTLAKQNSLSHDREVEHEEVRKARTALDTQRDQLHRLTVTINTLTSELNAARASLARIQQQVSDLSHRQQQIKDQLGTIAEPLETADQKITEALTLKVEKQQYLADTRDKLAEIEKELRDLEQLQVTQTQAMDRARNDVETGRLALATSEARCTTIVEQLAALEADLSEVIASLPEHANESEWAIELEAIGQRIKRLGAINLAAIEEYATSSERKQYLDSQHDDVLQALTTLEEAIQKIDQETRLSFKQTYTTINQHLAELFPQIFSGGEAYLELTEDDILNAGVRIIARPPGKKNSSIHLLSGGEKALTAIALVFSFFRLQPSPFCMLDEVDAPLDDANVGRYCNLVKQMSKYVQFIVITHNKITMEMADHLTGVTMREPGVSRLVSVSMDEAATLVG